MKTVDSDLTWAKALFAIVDDGTPEEFAALLTEDAVLRFGNADPVSGRDNIRQMSKEFRESLAGLHHDVLSAGRIGDTVMAELAVTYVRHDGQTVTLPCANAFDVTDDGLIKRYQIYMDIAPVFAPS